MYKIMIVEDDFGIAGSVSKHLKQWEFDTVIAENFKDIAAEYAKHKPQLILMDIVLPFFNGYHWCNEIRKISKVPIIFVSSASDNMNIVMAMNMGADDFISKPFDYSVLIAKIQAILRRTYDFSNEINVLEHRSAFLDTNANTLTYNEANIPLTKNEYRILHCLMENKGKVVSREFLMERLWKTDTFIDENTLTVNINRLRKKLDSYGLNDFIITKFGVGYILG